MVRIDAAGKLFCAGGRREVLRGAWGRTLPGGHAGAHDLSPRGDLHARRARGHPVVTVVQGAAAGALACRLAAAGDLVLAAESAQFTMAYTGIGVSPDGSSSYFLPRLIGLRRTQELMITNRRLTAAEARDWGLVTEVVPDDELWRLAPTTLCGDAGPAGPTHAYGSVKRPPQRELHEHRSSRRWTWRPGCFVENARTADGREGIQAFVEKRKPSFQGC